jgi:hypothetical protein
MKRLLALAAAASLLPGATTAQAPSSPEAFLTGNWMRVDDHPGNACGSPVATGEQVAFEFARSGGRLLRYEPPDLFTSVGGLQLEQKGDVVTASIEGRGALGGLRRIHADDFEMLDREGKALSRWHRCPALPDPIGPEVSTANLLALTPARSGGQSLRELLPEEEPSVICKPATEVSTEGMTQAEMAAEGARQWEQQEERRKKGHTGWIQFEILAPGHSMMLTNDVAGLGFFVRVTAIHQIAPDTLRLSLDALNKGKREITVRIAADHIDIPELDNASFARCTEDVGMHRM